MSNRRFDGNSNGGIHLLPSQEQQPQMVIAAPFNDIQLIAMVASQALDHLVEASAVGAAADVVDLAIDIVAHAILKGGRLQARVQELAAAAQPKLEG